MPATTSTDRLLDVDGIAQRRSSFQFTLVDVSLNSIGTLAPDMDSVPSIGNDMNASTKRTLSNLRLSPSEQSDVNPLADRVRAEMVLENGVVMPWGVFLFADASRDRRTQGQSLAGSLVDQTIIVDQPTVNSVGFAPGTRLDMAMASCFADLPMEPSIESTSLVVGGDSWLVWPIATSMLTIVNDLAALAGYYSLYFDNAGVPTLRSVPDLSGATPTLVYEAGGRIYDGSIVESDDLLKAPNRYLVVDSGATDTPISGYYDVPDSAPYSAAVRGFVVTKVITAQGIASAAAAQAMAQAAAAQDAAAYQWAEWTSPPDPRHDTYDAVTYLGATWREQAWDCELIEGGTMRHKARRVWT